MISCATLFASFALSTIALEVFHHKPLSLFMMCFIFLISFYGFSVLFYRLMLAMYPIKEGLITEKSKDECVYNIYLLFKLFFFFPIIRTKLIPVPFTRLMYIGLGAKIGSNTYSGGTILDPPLTILGTNTIIGEDSLLFSHVIEGRKLSHSLVKIGDCVTIGAKSIIMPGVKIGNGSIIAAGSVVIKGTEINENEIWGGTPAKYIKQVDM